MDGPSYRGEEPINLDPLRERLRKMTEEQLVQFGKAARFMCRDKSPRQVFVIQLEEARAEWRRRHPLTPRARLLGIRQIPSFRRTSRLSPRPAHFLPVCEFLSGP